MTELNQLIKKKQKKDQGIIELLRKKLLEPCTVDQRQTWLEAIVDAELQAALHDTSARKNLLDRLYGKAIESVELSGRDGEAIAITIKEIEVVRNAI